jgi:DNA-binding helix-hairpin-helix protein with protein kinase domain
MRILRAVFAIISGIGALAVFSVSGWLSIILGVTALGMWPGEDAETTARRRELAVAKSAYDQLVAALGVTGNGAEHRGVRAQLETARRQLQDLPAKRTAELARLERDKRQVQLEAFLEPFRIAKALIPGIGPLRTATLESYGIETAADITEAAITAVPGFGSVMAGKLVSWRRQVEGSFVFDPSKPINPARIARLDADIARERSDLVQKLRDGPVRLTAAKASVERRRQDLLAEIGAAARRLAQAQADVA